MFKKLVFILLNPTGEKEKKLESLLSFQFDLLFFTIFFICPFALSLNEKWTFRVWLLIKLSNILLEITKTNKE